MTDDLRTVKIEICPPSSSAAISWVRRMRASDFEPEFADQMVRLGVLAQGYPQVPAGILQDAVEGRLGGIARRHDPGFATSWRVEVAVDDDASDGTWEWLDEEAVCCWDDRLTGDTGDTSRTWVYQAGFDSEAEAEEIAARLRAVLDTIEDAFVTVNVCRVRRFTT